MASEAAAAAATNSKRLMIAIDESECSHYALEWALVNLPDYLSSASSVYVFTAQPLDDFGYFQAASLGAAPLDLMKNLGEQQDKVAKALLEKAKEICVNRGVTPVTITEAGDPKEAICAAVEKYNINLLVIGSNGKGAIKRTFLGSVSNYCVHHAKCPVLVVRKQE